MNLKNIFRLYFKNATETINNATEITEKSISDINRKWEILLKPTQTIKNFEKTHNHDIEVEIQENCYNVDTIQEITPNTPLLTPTQSHSVNEKIFDNVRAGKVQEPGKRYITTPKGIDFLADQYIQTCSTSGSFNDIGEILIGWHKTFHPELFEASEFDSENFPLCSRNNVARCCFLKGLIIEQKFLVDVLPFLEDMAIQTDATTIEKRHFDQLYLSGFSNTTKKMCTYVVAIEEQKIGLSKKLYDWIKGHHIELQKLQPKFNLKKIKYLISDHCSNNSGKKSGLIRYLKNDPDFNPNIIFVGCKYHLINLMIKDIGEKAAEKLILIFFIL